MSFNLASDYSTFNMFMVRYSKVSMFKDILIYLYCSQGEIKIRVSFGHKDGVLYTLDTEGSLIWSPDDSFVKRYKEEIDKAYDLIKAHPHWFYGPNVNATELDASDFQIFVALMYQVVHPDYEFLFQETSYNSELDGDRIFYYVLSIKNNKINQFTNKEIINILCRQKMPLTDNNTNPILIRRNHETTKEND